MPKYWGGNYFAHRRFPEALMAHASRLGQLVLGANGPRFALIAPCSYPTGLSSMSSVAIKD